MKELSSHALSNCPHKEYLGRTVLPILEYVDLRIGQHEYLNWDAF